MEDLTPGERWLRGAATAALLGPTAAAAEVGLRLLHAPPPMSTLELGGTLLTAVLAQSAVAGAFGFVFGFTHPRLAPKDPTTGLSLQLGLAAAALSAAHLVPVALAEDALGESAAALTVAAQIPLIGTLTTYAARVALRRAPSTLHRVLLGVAAAALSLAVLSPLRSAQRAPAGVGALLITVDALPSAALTDGSMPRLRAWSSGAAVWSRAAAPSAAVVTSAATALTGLHPSRHQATDDAHALRPGVSTLARMLDGDAAAWVGDLRLAPHTGLADGFATWSSGPLGAVGAIDRLGLTRRLLGGWLGGPARVDDEALVSQALPSVRALDHGLIWVHLSGGRAPWPDTALPDRGAGAAAWAPAAAAAATARAGVDRALAELLDAAPAGVPVIVAGLRGLSLGAHDRGPDDASVYEEAVSVPILVRASGVAPGARDDLASLADIAPTLLALVDPPPPRLEGVSLLATALRPSWVPLLGMAPGGGQLLGLRTSDVKAMLDVRSGALSVWDLAADPGERDDLAAAQPEMTAMVEGLLTPEREALERITTRPTRPNDLSARLATER